MKVWDRIVRVLSAPSQFAENVREGNSEDAMRSLYAIPIIGNMIGMGEGFVESDWTKVAAKGISIAGSFIPGGNILVQQATKSVDERSQQVIGRRPRQRNHRRMVFKSLKQSIKEKLVREMKTTTKVQVARELLEDPEYLEGIIESYIAAGQQAGPKVITSIVSTVKDNLTTLLLDTKRFCRDFWSYSISQPVRHHDQAAEDRVNTRGRIKISKALFRGLVHLAREGGLAPVKKKYVFDLINYNSPARSIAQSIAQSAKVTREYDGVYMIAVGGRPMGLIRVKDGAFTFADSPWTVKSYHDERIHIYCDGLKAVFFLEAVSCVENKHPTRERDQSLPTIGGVPLQTIPLSGQPQDGETPVAKPVVYTSMVWKPETDEFKEIKWVEASSAIPYLGFDGLWDLRNDHFPIQVRAKVDAGIIEVERLEDDKWVRVEKMSGCRLMRIGTKQQAEIIYYFTASGDCFYVRLENPLDEFYNKVEWITDNSIAEKDRFAWSRPGLYSEGEDLAEVDMEFYVRPRIRSRRSTIMTSASMDQIDTRSSVSTVPSIFTDPSTSSHTTYSRRSSFMSTGRKNSTITVNSRRGSISSFKSRDPVPRRSISFDTSNVQRKESRNRIIRKKPFKTKKIARACRG